MILNICALIFGIFVYSGKAADICVCSTTNDFNVFNVSNYIRFQSPNYPASMDTSWYTSSSPSLKCNSLFVPGKKGDYLWFAMINGAFMEASINDNKTYSPSWIGYTSNYDVQTYTSTSGVLSFQFLNDLGQNQLWTAFDAVVLPFSPSSASDCPFSGQTIALDNDTIIPISSDYGIYANASKNCSWTFKNDDPNNYQFKIYIKVLSRNYQLTIKNDNTTNGFGFNVSLYDPQVLYLKGSELNIMISNIKNVQDHNGFFAIISTVPVSADYIQKCVYANSDSGLQAISNLDFENGYDPFTMCTFEMEVKNGYEAVLEVSEFWLEAGVDRLTVSKGNQSWDIKNEGFFKVKSDFDGSIFKFMADGNIRQAGFNASYNQIKCECGTANFAIPCTGNTLLTPLPNGVSSFCDNQDCSYTISLSSSCSLDYFTIEPSADLRDTAWLAIYVNGTVFQNYTNYASPEILPFPRNTNLTIAFHSGQSPLPFLIGNPQWSIKTAAISSPVTSKVMLNSTSPTNAVSLDAMVVGQAITVCSPDNDLELFITLGLSLNNFDLYDSDGLTNFVGTLSDSSFPATSPGSSLSHVMSKSGCFTIYCSEQSSYTLSTALFRMQKTHVKNCNTAQNVVRLLQDVPASYTVDAKASGSCEMIVFAERYNLNPLLSFDGFLTTSNATFSFSSGLNGKPYFDMPSNEIDVWKQTALYTPVLSVLAPASSSLTFNISAGFLYINEGNAVRKGVLVSPLYSGTNSTAAFLAPTMYSFNLNNTRSANFHVKDLSPSAIVTLQNLMANESHKFIENEYFSTNASSFYISAVQNGNNAFRIEYGFDILVNEPTTSAPPTTTTTNNAIMVSCHFMPLLFLLYFVLNNPNF